MPKNEPTLDNIKVEEQKIADQLCYPKIVQEFIKKAKTEGEIYRIMADARNGHYN